VEASHINYFNIMNATYYFYFRQMIKLKLSMCVLSCIIINYASGQHLETVIQKGHELAVLTVAVSPDSSYVATGSRDKTIKLWELSTGREVRSFLGHTASINQIDFSSDGKYLISANGDATARIWEVATGKELHSVKPDEERVTDVAYDPKGKFFVTVGFGQKVRVWDALTQKKLAEMEADGYAGSGGLIHVAISPNGSR
jgi:WD40 repeat protein